MNKRETRCCVAVNEISKEKFIRDSYVELYSAADAPETIDNVEFSDVFEDTAYLVQQHNTYDIDYTVEIGYKHEEQYIDEEKYYDANLRQHLKRNVVKNRTVTHWQPYKGSESSLRGAATCYCNDGDSINIGDKDEEISSQYGHYDFDVQSVLFHVAERPATEEEQQAFPVLSDADHRSLASKPATNSSFYPQIASNIPGDENRNFNANWQVTNMLATIYAVNRYKLAFDYEGHRCFIKQFASERFPHIYCSYKYIDSVAKEIDDKENNQLNNDPKFQKNVKIYKIGTVASLVLGVLSLGLSGALGGVAFIGIIAAVIGFIVSYRFGKKMKSQGEAIHAEYENKRAEHFSKMQAKKIDLLNARFAKMGFPPLSEEELQRFSDDCKHKLTEHFFGE